MAKAKSKKEDDIFKNLKGFCQLGARAESPGNIPTGHFNLDFIIQYGQDPTKVDLNKVEGYDPAKTVGIPLGKLVEVFGEEGSGKSSLAYRICGYAQKLGYKTGWIDVEHSFQENLAYINGCDIDQLIYSNMINHEDPEKEYFAEDVIDYMIKMMQAGIQVIVLDSVANLIPKALFEAKTEKEFMGLLSRLLSKSLGKLVSYAEKHGTLLVFINQLREKIGNTWGDPRTSPGGHSLHHNASLRLRMDKSRDSMDVPVYYEAYFPEIDEIAFDTGRQIKLISVRKGVFNWDGLKIEGRKQFIEHIIKENMTDALIEAIKVKATENELILPPEIVLYGTE
jgi:RecA/RadA recombinase